MVILTISQQNTTICDSLTHLMPLFVPIGKKDLFGRHYDVIQQNDGIFRFWKCLQCVPSHIFCRIWDEIGKKVILDGSNYRKWWYFAAKCSKWPFLTSGWRHTAKWRHFQISKIIPKFFSPLFVGVYVSNLGQICHFRGLNRKNMHFWPFSLYI